MGWRDYAERTQHTRDNRDDKDNSLPNGPNGPNVPPLDPVRAVSQCRSGLVSLDPLKPLHGHSELRWRRLLEDADWVLEHFAAQAFRDSWTVGEMFGLWW